MIYTLGYQKLPVPEFQRILREKHIDCIVDVRSKPHGRAHQYNKNSLATAYGDKYQWLGATLGGFGEIGDDSIKDLAASFLPDLNYLIICFEADPRECHRHYEIGRRMLPLGVDIIPLQGSLEIKESSM